MGFGPPVEVGAPFEEVGRGFEGAAAFGDDGVELLDGFEVFVGDGLVEHRPEAFGRFSQPAMQVLGRSGTMAIIPKTAGADHVVARSGRGRRVACHARNPWHG